MNKKSILFVDDEPNILKGLRRSLYPLRNKWKMTFVEGGIEALEIMEQDKPTVLISDMRMPGMNGLELLENVRERHPEVVRVMLTGQSDKDLYQKAMGISHHFFWKPTKFETFKELLERIHDLDTILHNSKLVQLIGRLTSLPSLPVLYIRLTDLLEKTDIDSNQVAKVVSEDIAMTVQLLKLVNSALFGISRKIVNLQEAVSYLGLDTIRSFALAQHLFSQCNNELFKRFKLDQLWTHSLCVAIQARQRASQISQSTQARQDAYVGGILHDVGKLILASFLPESYQEVLDETEKSNRSQSEVEVERLGADHASIGAYLTCLWGMPRTITEAVAFHHHVPPLSGTDAVLPVSEAVWHADRICHGGHSMSEQYGENREE